MKNINSLDLTYDEAVKLIRKPLVFTIIFTALCDILSVFMLMSANETIFAIIIPILSVVFLGLGLVVGLLIQKQTENKPLTEKERKSGSNATLGYIVGAAGGLVGVTVARGLIRAKTITSGKIILLILVIGGIFISFLTGYISYQLIYIKKNKQTLYQHRAKIGEQ